MSKPPTVRRAAVLIQVACLLVSASGRESPVYQDWTKPDRLQFPQPDYPTYPDFPEPHFNFPWLPVTLGFFGLIIFACLCTLGYRGSKSRTREAQAILNRTDQVAALESDTTSRVNGSTEFHSQEVVSDAASNFRPSAPPLVQPAATPSLDTNKLISFKMHSGKAAETCGICLEPYGISDVTVGQCLHVFHTACLKTWLAKERSHELCPLCRNPFQGVAQDAEQFMKLLKSAELIKPVRSSNVRAVES